MLYYIIYLFNTNNFLIIFFIIMFNIFQKNIPNSIHFSKSIYWNVIDSLGTQAMLIIHHLLVRHFMGISFHAVFGCSLSLFYLFLIVLNLGLDFSIAPFLTFFIQDKQTFKNFLFRQLILQWIFTILLSATACFINAYFNIYDLPNIAIACAFITESIRKTIKYFLQLTFSNKITSLVEVSGMACYILFIWSLYYFKASITISICWQALAAISAIQLIILLYYFYLSYKNLATSANITDSKSDIDNRDMWKRITKTRLATWTNALATQLFSDNFLVPLTALQLGFEQASFIKIITSISRWINLIAQKVFGVSSSAILAQIKTSSFPTQQAAFLYLTHYMHQALYALIIFLLVNGKKIALMQSINMPFITWSTLYFMLIIAFFESFFTLYEKWYLIKEQAHYFLFFNFFSFLILYCFIPYLSSCYAIFLSVILIRVATFLILSFFSFYKFKISPSLYLSPKTIYFAIVISALFYFIM